MSTVYEHCGFLGFGKTEFDIPSVCAEGTAFRDGKCVSTRPLCDPTTNFVSDGPSYRQVAFDKNISYVDAVSRCEGESTGDFFVQQHQNGHTICGMFDESLSDDSKFVAHDHKFGAVCRRE